VESNSVGSNGRWWLNAYSSTRWWVGVFALWTVFGVLMAGHVQVRFGGRPGFLTHLLSIVPFYWAWVPMTPLIIRVAERFDFRGGHRMVSVGGQFAGGLAVIVAHSLLYSVYRTLLPLGEPGGFVTVVLRTIPRHAAGDFTTYAVLAGAALALQQYRRGQMREREAARTALRAARLEAQLSAARLDALQMQLHPHFLFNALNTISVLVLKGAGTGAIRAIRQLADLLRVALYSAGTPERPLEEEIAFVGRYLAIEKLRFGDGLHFDVDLAEESAAALVPHLILQPLIENAVIHGLRSKGRGGRIRVTARRDDGRLRLEVWDDGAGLAADGRNLSEGLGLTNTRARLRELYGDDARLNIASAKGGGTVAAIHLPFHTDSPTDAAGVVA
jgi:two-component system LytT family sensor kinase